MLKRSLVLLILAAFLAAAAPVRAQKWEYPAARRAEQVDDFHGAKVEDPYRWMEDTESA